MTRFLMDWLSFKTDLTAYKILSQEWNWMMVVRLRTKRKIVQNGNNCLLRIL